MRVRKVLWSNTEEPILVIMALLILIGTINVFSSSYVLAMEDYQDPYYFFKRHLIWLFLGTVLCAAFARMNYARLRNATATWSAAGIISVLLLAVLFVGVEINGAKRWITFSGFSLQPAEYAKLISIILCTKAFAYQVRKGKKITLFHPILGLLAFYFFLIFKEPDMGTASIVVGIPVAMAVFLGMRARQRNILFILLVVVLPAAIISELYRMDRMKVFFDPWSDAQSTGYQTVQSILTVGSGGLLGMGGDTSVSKYEYLPEAHTDFAFSILSQEHGYVGVLFVFLLFILLILSCERVANRARDTYGQVLALGIMLLISGQALVNLGMVSGIVPVVGVPLPFISYGGSSLTVTMAAIGILLSISRNGVSKEERQELDRRELEAEHRQIEKRRAAIHRVK